MPIIDKIAGYNQLVDGETHILTVIGSSPIPATKLREEATSLALA